MDQRILRKGDALSVTVTFDQHQAGNVIASLDAKLLGIDGTRTNQSGIFRDTRDGASVGGRRRSDFSARYDESNYSITRTIQDGSYWLYIVRSGNTVPTNLKQNITTAVEEIMTAYSEDQQKEAI